MRFPCNEIAGFEKQILAPTVPRCVHASDLSFEICVSLVVKSLFSYQDKITIVVDDKPIKQICTKTYLGVKIDNHHSWEHHIDSLVAKARGKLHAIRRMMPLPRN